MNRGKRELILSLLLFLILSALSSLVYARSPYPYEPDFGRVALGRNDDGSAGPFDLGFEFTLYGTTYTQFWINNNGNITFHGPMWTYTPFAFPNDQGAVIIAPFFADVDTRGSGSGVVYINDSTPGQVVITWDRVGYYGWHTDKLNSFQLILQDDATFGFDDGDHIGFCYGDLEWTTGDASGGSGGLGGTPAAAGFDSGNGVDALQLAGSFTAGILNLANTICWFNASGGIPGDITPPETVIDVGPAEGDHLTVTTVTFEWNGVDNVTDPADLLFSYRLDSEPYTEFSSETSHTYINLSEGIHTFEVRAKDEAGNIDPTPAIRSFGVDLTPPDTLLTAGPSDGGWANATSVTFEWTGVDNVSDVSELLFAYKLDDGDFTPFGPETDHTFNNLVEGIHTFIVKAKDKAGYEDPTPLTISFTVDVTPPEAKITSGPDEGAVLSSTQATFKWTGNDNFTATSNLLFAYQLDANPFSGFSPDTTHIFSSLTSGDHILRVRAKDEAGNESTPVERHFSVDLPPDTNITAGPGEGAVINTDTVTFEWSGTDDITPSANLLFSYQLDAEPFSAFTSDTAQTFSGLSEGVHTFRVKAKDEANNEDATPATCTFTVDTTPPETTITAGPEEGAMVTTPDVTFNWIGADNLTAVGNLEYSYRIDADEWSDFSSDTGYTFTGLSQGAHTFSVKARDLGGNEDATPAVRTFTVTLPEQPMNPNPANGAVNVPTNTSLTWQAAYAQSYDLFLWKEGEAKPGIPTATDLTTASFNPGILESGKTYNWQVVAKNLVGSTEGAQWSFTTETRPDLQVASVTVPATAWSGQTVEVSWTITNSGDGATDVPLWYDDVYLSASPTFSLDTSSLVGRSPNASYLAPGESYVESKSITLPDGISGDYYIFVITDASNRVRESDEDNNRGRNTVVMHVNLTPPPDLQVTNVNVPGNGWSGQSISVSWTVTNAGSGNTRASAWTDIIYGSPSETFDPGSATLLGSFYHDGVLIPGDSYTQSQTVTLPIGISGPYYIFVQTDSTNSVYEHAWEENNIGRCSVPINVTLTPPPDLEVTSITAPATANSGQSIDISWTVTNAGPGDTASSMWYDKVYLFAGDSLNPDAAINLGFFRHIGVLGVGQSYTQSRSVTLPNGISGPYYLFVWTDSDNQVFEHTWEDNNIGRTASPIQVELTPWADLQVIAIDAPANVQTGQSISVRWTVANAGTGETPVSSWSDRLYLSTSGTLDPNTAIVLGTFSHYGKLAPGDSYEQIRTVGLPFNLPASCYLFIWTDWDNSVFEHTDEDNNVGRSAVQIQITPMPLPDLTVTSVDAPATANSGQPISVTWTVQNTGGGTTRIAQWGDALYLSSDAVLDKSSDIYLGTLPHNGSLVAGASYTVTNTITLPNGISGPYYMFVVTDANNRVEETDESNNSGMDSASIQVSLSPWADLQVMNVDAPATWWAGQPITVSWTVINEGESATPVSRWYDAVYLSRDTSLDGSDQLLGSVAHDGALGVGESYNQSLQASLPGFASGDYYLIVLT
ncbi:TPA: hypothetical protein ENG04_03660, partial [Candidatus Poribacteria bacterium]|nr:hypothetical protein [Candidatus Poribacteria bacterium]HEX29157.1 hypothetical protein [Candidatus Poribacteria bacterium]